MRSSDVLAIASTTFFGAITGFLVGGQMWAVVLAGFFGALALVGSRANVRPSVVSTVLVGTMTGGLIGASIVEAICLPSSCSALEISSGVVSAMISFVGVGLVAALVARSFDEHNERERAGLPPTEVGCEIPDPNEDV